MKKKLLVALFLCGFMQAWAAYWTDDNGISWFYTISDGNAENLKPTDKNSISGAVAIPSIVNGYRVTSIGEEAFYCCFGLTSVTIPSSVTSIGEEAFYGCTGLTSVTIPSSVTSIGNYAFYFCDGLTSVTIPNNVTSIGDCAFCHCHGLTSVTIPSSVTSIGWCAFSSCYGLTTVIINSNAIMSKVYTSSSNIGYLFYDCEVKKFIIGEGVTSIGDNAFYFYSALTSVIIPSSVTSIGEFAFAGCTGLTNVIIPSSVTSIGDGAFIGCSGLTSVFIPSSVMSIGGGAFRQCYGLTSITVASGNTIYDSRDNCNAIIETASNTLIQGCDKTVIPSSVTGIGLGAFYGCSGLTSVIIPSSVTYIDINAFNCCDNIHDIYCYAVSCPSVWEDNVFPTFSSYTSTLHVPEASLQQYKNHSVWGKFYKIVPIDESTAIDDIDREDSASEIEAIYDQNGQRQPALRRGINIIKMNDGTIKKVLVK